MAISTDYQRALLRTLSDEFADTGRTLLQSIKDLRKARVENTKTGSVITSTAANGHAVSFDVARCNPHDIAALASRLEDVFADAKAVLVAAGTAVPTDAEMLTQMLLHPALTGMRSYRADFSEYGQPYVD